MEDIVKRIGLKIRSYRNELGLTQEALAEKCNLHPTYVGQIERGEKNASISSIQKIADGLELPVENLFLNQTQIKTEPWVTDRIYCFISELDAKEQKILLEFMFKLKEFKQSK